MKNNLTALFLSLFLHVILFVLFFLQFKGGLEDIYNPPTMGSEQGDRISLKHFRFHQGDAMQKMESENIKDSKVNVESPKNPAPNTQKEEIKSAQKTQDKPSVTQKTESKKDSRVTKPKQTQKLSDPSRVDQTSKTAISNALEKSLSSPSIYDFGISEQTQQIQDLYGVEFGSLSQNAQKFIKNNLDNIGKITQRYLKYPSVAGKVGQEGDNVVEFYLHPNGDISDLRLLHSSGYTLLDNNSLHTIKIAYKDYPYPSEKTKIRIRVMYRIY